MIEQVLQLSLISIDNKVFPPPVPFGSVIVYSGLVHVFINFGRICFFCKEKGRTAIHYKVLV